jgi:hypothetical protein
MQDFSLYMMPLPGSDGTLNRRMALDWICRESIDYLVILSRALAAHADDVPHDAYAMLANDVATMMHAAGKVLSAPDAEAAVTVCRRHNEADDFRADLARIVLSRDAVFGGDTGAFEWLYEALGCELVSQLSRDSESEAA